MISSWEELSECIKDCKKCGLCEGRTNIVIGVGEHNTNIMLIGEGPGADEDAQGIPFVGKAGQLMNQAFAGLGIDRSKLYIANVVKCRPPQNRGFCHVWGQRSLSDKGRERGQTRIRADIEPCICRWK